MYCSSCGNQLPEDARFCEKCGTPVDKVAVGNQRQSKDISGSGTSATNQKPEYPGRDWKETGAAAFQEFSGNVMSAADHLGLDQWQRITSVIAVCSVLAFLICITGTLASWLSTISGIILLIFCLKKKTYDSMELALAMTVFIMRFVTVDIRVLFGEYIYYHKSTMIMRIVLYALLVIYWLAVTGKFQRRETGMAWVLILSGVTVVYSAFDVFLSFSFGFRSVLFSMGKAGFFACYVILISRDQKIMDYIRAAFGLRASGIKQSFGQTNFHSDSAEAETKIQTEVVIQPETMVQPESVNQPGPSVRPESDIQSEPLVQPESGIRSEPSVQPDSQEETADHQISRPLFCLSCGNRLPADAAFCEHCGAAIDAAAQEKRCS